MVVCGFLRWVHCDAVWAHHGRHVHPGLQLPHVCGAGLRTGPVQLRRKAGLWITPPALPTDPGSTSLHPGSVHSLIHIPCCSWPRERRFRRWPRLWESVSKDFYPGRLSWSLYGCMWYRLETIRHATCVWLRRATYMWGYRECGRRWQVSWTHWSLSVGDVLQLVFLKSCCFSRG